MLLSLNTKYDAIECNGNMMQLSLWEIFSRSEKTLLYFYPKNDTPGCTLENQDFTCIKDEFDKLWITLIGVSKDPIESHRAFREKYKLEVWLISDPDLLLHKALWAYGDKNNYGKIVTWVIRSTFLFDKQGSILQEWRNVRAKGHAAKVLREIEK